MYVCEAPSRRYKLYYILQGNLYHKDLNIIMCMVNYHAASFTCTSQLYGHYYTYHTSCICIAGYMQVTNFPLVVWYIHLVQKFFSTLYSWENALQLPYIAIYIAENFRGLKFSTISRIFVVLEIFGCQISWISLIIHDETLYISVFTRVYIIYGLIYQVGFINGVSVKE